MKPGIDFSLEPILIMCIPLAVYMMGSVRNVHCTIRLVLCRDISWNMSIQNHNSHILSALIGFASLHLYCQAEAINWLSNHHYHFTNKTENTTMVNRWITEWIMIVEILEKRLLNLRRYRRVQKNPLDHLLFISHFQQIWIIFHIYD